MAGLEQGGLPSVDVMIDETDDVLGSSPESVVGERRRRAGVDLARELRDSAADRVPLPVRVVPRAVPWQAAVAALLLAVTVAVAVLARLHGTASGSSVIPARPANRTAAKAVPSAGSAEETGTSASFPPAAPGVASGAGAGAGGGAGTVPGGAKATVGVVVDVTGRVRRPGLVRLPPGSRVWDAVTAAGGAGSGARLDRINLARPLADGEQVLVPGPNDPLPATTAPPVTPSPGGSGGRPGAAESGAKVDLNSATQAELDALPGVGPVLAGRILAWRTEHGRFSRVEELGEVSGIGDKLLAQLTPLVRA